jgi:hypothetical protein
MDTIFKDLFSNMDTRPAVIRVFKYSDMPNCFIHTSYVAMCIQIVTAIQYNDKFGYIVSKNEKLQTVPCYLKCSNIITYNS